MILNLFFFGIFGVVVHTLCLYSETSFSTLSFTVWCYAGIYAFLDASVAFDVIAAFAVYAPIAVDTIAAVSSRALFAIRPSASLGALTSEAC